MQTEKHQINKDGDLLNITFNTFGPDEYDLFLRVKKLPESTLDYNYETDRYTVGTHSRYAHLLGIEVGGADGQWAEYPDFLFEHQVRILDIALKAKRYAVWANVGLGKTLIELEFARQVAAKTNGRVLLLTLNEIVSQTIDECARFYGDTLKIKRLGSRAEMREWCKSGDGEHDIAITNYEKMNPDEEVGQVVPELKYLSALVLDESSRLKAGGGKQKWAIIHSAKGIPYKLSCTATPAPNDYIEFASQASFLERMRDENEIIWTFFTKDKETQEWTVKRHARKAFFEWMASWSIYLKTPQAFGWSSDFTLPPEPDIIQHDIPITKAQVEKARLFNTDSSRQPSLFVRQSQGVVGRSKLSQIAKGFVYVNGRKDAELVKSHKPEFVARLIQDERQAGRQVLVWTVFDKESELIADTLQDGTAVVLSGATPKPKRAEILDGFRKGDIDVLISKSQLLGYGMNFQNCGAMIFSGWNDSFESFYQAVGRAVRFGQKRTVRVHIPYVRELEYAQLETVLRKADAFETAIAEQEKAYIKAMEELEIL